MDRFASALIDRLGGTAQVAHLADAPMSTVHNMRRKLTGSRLNHLRRIAMMEGLADEVGALAHQFGVDLHPLGCRNDGRGTVHTDEVAGSTDLSSCGKIDEISAQVIA